jgi:6-phosphogluconolactonase
MNGTVTIYPDSASLARGAAAWLRVAAQAAIADHGRCTIALSGGSTPRALFTVLAAQGMPPDVDYFWSDERCVPPDAAESNYRMAREALLDPVGVDVARIHRLRGELVPDAAADAYETELRARFPGMPWPRFDVVLLGLGEDGHAASLFPGTAALDATERWVIATHVPRLDAWRLTLTLPAINHAARVALLVSGSAKADILRAVLDGQADLPAARVAPEAGDLLWLVDAAAAAALPAVLLQSERVTHVV